MGLKTSRYDTEMSVCTSGIIQSSCAARRTDESSAQCDDTSAKVTQRKLPTLHAGLHIDQFPSHAFIRMSRRELSRSVKNWCVSVQVRAAYCGLFPIQKPLDLF